MDRHGVARMVMTADAVGCAAACVAAATPAATVVADSRRGRMVLVTALAGSSLILGQGLLRRRLRPTDLALGAVVNAAWVATCVSSAGSRPQGFGRMVVLTTAVLDGAAGLGQAGLAVAARRS